MSKETKESGREERVLLGRPAGCRTSGVHGAGVPRSPKVRIMHFTFLKDSCQYLFSLIEKNPKKTHF